MFLRNGILFIVGGIIVGAISAYAIISPNIQVQGALPVIFSAFLLIAGIWMLCIDARQRRNNRRR